MGVYEELQERGLIAQITNEDEVRELINNGKAVFYIGFDPTADSLHVGHFMALCLMKRLQMAGNKPIALIGGGTGMIGDPSGKTDMRKMLTPEIIQHNCDCFKKQMSKFIDFSDGKAMMVNNADWLLDLNYINVLREVGACFSVNRMLSFECYKQRMERGLSFLEFNYMIMQSYDFYTLYKKYGCNLQFGDDDVIKCMKLLTFIPMEQINEYAKLEGAELNKVKEILAFELTKMIHGEEEATKAQNAAKALFAGGADNSHMPETVLTDDDFTDGSIMLLDMMVKAGIIKSKGEGRRLITQGGVSVNDEKATDPNMSFTTDDFSNEIIVKKGKKVFHKFSK